MTKTGNSYSQQLQKLFIFTTQFLFWVLVSSVLPIEAAWSSEIQVEASVDKQELTLEDSVYFSIVVEGTQNSPSPELPPLDSFKIRPLGFSSSIQIVNGRQSSSITYNFVLIPKETGTFTINPATVKIDGNKYQTAPITLVVREASAIPDTSREVFAELVVSNKKPYVREQVTATLRIYHRVRIRNLVTDVKFPGFRKKSLNEPVQNVRMVNGIRYLSYEISTALFPLRAGKTEIPVSIIELDKVDQSRSSQAQDPFDFFGHGSIFNNFGRLEHKTLRTEVIILDVQPLPQKNRPKNFSNLVGEFTISTKLSRTEVEMGDTTTLTVTVAGQGNIKDFLLASPRWGNDFKVYEDQPDSQKTNGAQTVSGEKIYTFALVPLKSGNLSVPSIHLNYFDPTKGDYLSIQTQPLSLAVSPGKGDPKFKMVEPGTSNANKTGGSIKKTGEDILPIHTGPDVFENQDLSTQSWILYGIGLLLPAVFFLAYNTLHKRQERLKNDVAFSRRQGAYKQALKKMAALPPDNDSREIVRELSLIIREYLGNILNLQGTAITSTEVKEKLIRGNFSPDEIQMTQELLEKHETFQYAPTEGSLPENLIQDARNLLDQLENKS